MHLGLFALLVLTFCWSISAQNYNQNYRQTGAYQNPPRQQRPSAINYNQQQQQRRPVAPNQQNRPFQPQVRPQTRPQRPQNPQQPPLTAIFDAQERDPCGPDEAYDERSNRCRPIFG